MEIKNIHKLEEDAKKARAAGMSYGKWMAMQLPTEHKDSVPKGWKVCPQCGKPFKPAQGKIYCDIYCRTQAYAPKAREMSRAYYVAKRKVKKDGLK